MVNYHPELDSVLNEATETWDVWLSQLQQPQIHQIQHYLHDKIKML